MNSVCPVPVWHLIASKHDTVSSEAGLKLFDGAVRASVGKLGGYKGAGILEEREAKSGKVVAAGRNIQVMAEIAKTPQAYNPRNRAACLIDPAIDQEGVYLVRQLAGFAVLAARRNSPLDVGIA